MKAFLMYPDRDFDLQVELPWNAPSLTQDLELNTLFQAMSSGDEFLLEVAKRAVLSGLNNGPDTILYRQAVLKDCLKNPSIVRSIYDLAVEAITRERKNYLGSLGNYPGWILHRSREVLGMFVEMLKKLRAIADEHAGQFESTGFTTFFAMLDRELSDDYFANVQSHLKEVEFRDGVLVSAELGKGHKGANYSLRKPHVNHQSWLQRLLAPKPLAYTFYIADRDDAGAKALSQLKDRGINLVSHALGQSNDHILSFFTLLRAELAFYIGGLNLHARLTQKSEPTTFPVPIEPHVRRHSYRGLYDVCLTLSLEPRVVGNDGNADRKDLVIITGANQGGKSTFLRSIGLSQLMMQCGLFVPAESFCANVCDRLFTHYKREEDAAMNSGKLDEELGRMSDIVDHLSPNSMVLFNESFAATNEREGSEIARQIVRALLDKHLKVFCVTHLYEFAHGFYAKHLDNTLCLRAERQPDGERTFKVIEGEPLQTSYGEDVYTKIFEAGS
jgi:hypothetical protein